MHNGTTVSESFQTIRRKLIDSLGADPSPDEAYAILRSVLIPFRRDEDCVSALAPRDRRIFPILIDIADAGVKAALKTVRLKAAAAAPSPPRETSGFYSVRLSCFCLPALRLALIGLLAGLILSGARQTSDIVLELCALAVLALIEAAPHFGRLRGCSERLLPGRDRRRSRDGATGASGAGQPAPGEEIVLQPARLTIDVPSFVDQLSDMLLSVDKTLHLVAEPSQPAPRTLISDKDALALMQDLIAARMDGDGARALTLLRQIEPLLLSYGVSVHPYCPELAGMFTIQSGPEGTAPATVRPALAASGRVLAFGVAETPRVPEEKTASPQPED